MACSDSNSTCGESVDNKYTLKLSRPAKRFYNTIGVNKGDDVTIDIPINNEDWIGVGYNVTIYDEYDRTTMASVGIDSNPRTVVIDNYNFGTTKAVVVIEDRSDINNIETIETIGYIYFRQFDVGATITTQEGSITYLNRDDSETAIPYYSTGF